MLKKILTVIMILLLTTLVACNSGPGKKKLSGKYLDPKLSPEERTEDLLAKMTVEEKVGQMTQVARDYLVDKTDITTYALGSLLSGGGSGPSINTAENWALMYDDFQTYALENRLGIPMIYGVDAVHGHNNVKGAVIYPHNIGLGAANNLVLTEKIARMTAIEVAATGIDWTFSPCIAIVQDERWGRTYESYSEDPTLVSKLGVASIKGYQGSSLIDGTSIAACAKHYLADGGTSGGIDRGNALYDDKAIREIFLAPYKTAVDAGVATIMASFSSVNGNPMHASKYLLTEVLKGELKFAGVVVSDWSALTLLPGDGRTQIKAAINAGIDMVMVPDKYQEFIFNLVTLVNDKEIPIERIDDAVRRILLLKFRMGLFEKPMTDKTLLEKVGSKEHRDIASQAVRESLVLLKNNGLLPIKSDVKKIAVLGSKANDIGVQCGGWTMTWQGKIGKITDGTTILDGIKANAPSGTEVIFSVDGKDIEGADLVIAVIGENPYAEMYGDDPDLELEETDLALIKAAASKPLVTILLSGRTMIINSALAESEAFVAAWLPGTEGAAIAEVLFGKSDFMGKLAFTWPASIDQLPINETVKNKSLFPFGYGLTYK